MATHSSVLAWRIPGTGEPGGLLSMGSHRGDSVSIYGIPWRRKRQPTPVFLPEKFHGRRSLAGYSPLGHKESDTTEQLSMHACMVRYTHIQVQINRNIGKTRKEFSVP